MTGPQECPFCAIAHDGAEATIKAYWHRVMAIVPLNPVVEGHVIVLPLEHVDDFAEDPTVTAMVMRRAAQYAAEKGGDWNLITSKGEAATATVSHLHVHLVPRVAGDGLALPWDPRGAA